MRTVMPIVRLVWRRLLSVPALLFDLAQQVFHLLDLGWIRCREVGLFSRIPGEVVKLRRGVVAEFGVGVRVDARPVVRLDVLPSALAQCQAAALFNVRR